MDRLIAARRAKEAEAWAREGFEKTAAQWSGIAWSLEAKLRGMSERKKDWPIAAAFRALEFFDRPGVERYAALEKAAQAAKAWPEVRAGVLGYLETGQRPDVPAEAARPASDAPRSKSHKGAKPRPSPLAPASPWPLPSTGLSLPVQKEPWRRFPDTATLIDIAIREKRNDDVLRWHAQEEAGGACAAEGAGAQYWHGGADDKVAAAVQKTHPDVALRLLLRLAEAQIAQVQPSAYQTAGGYLRKMEEVYARENRLEEWRGLLARLRQENKRRPRMIDVLNVLEGKRTRILGK